MMHDHVLHLRSTLVATEDKVLHQEQEPLQQPQTEHAENQATVLAFPANRPANKPAASPQSLPAAD